MMTKTAMLLVMVCVGTIIKISFVAQAKDKKSSSVDALDENDDVQFDDGVEDRHERRSFLSRR